MIREERTRIRQMVLACRRILQDEFDQLLSLHGLLQDKKIEPPPDRQNVRTKLDQALARETSDYVNARQRYVKHAAFTFLNCLLALRVAEAHRLIKETTTARSEYGDRALREFDLAEADPALAVAPERLAHEALKEAFSEMRTHIPLLFRENNSYILCLPRLPAYRQVRQTLVQVPEQLWRQSETLGWAYQYFNSEERSEIRSLHRNPEPDDIPPLNQFYTVEWIVKILVHNTLGRLWLETHPNSLLRAKLDYYVSSQDTSRPPTRNVSVWDIKVLDPACGSGHFLLGAFDLLLEIWEEELANRSAGREIYRWQIPSLILERNLFGVDIDLRACQIAAAALYLKARTAFERLKGNDPSARFELRRLNIVCADIRFIDSGRHKRFLQQFAGDAALSRIVEQTLTACGHAFDIGSLLRFRQPFERLFAQRTARPDELRMKQQQLKLADFLEEGSSDAKTSVPVPRFLTAEEIVMKVREFMREASETQDMGSLLFGSDAEQATHLVEVLTDQYDVILMNPPYGLMPERCQQYAHEQYPRTRRYYYTAFIEQAIDLCREGCYVGALTGRTFLFLESFRRLREEILREDALPQVVWDLGFNVLDEATARYAAFTLRRRWQGDGVDWSNHSVTFFRLTEWDWDEKRTKFEESLKALRTR